MHRTCISMLFLIVMGLCATSFAIPAHTMDRPGGTINHPSKMKETQTNVFWTWGVDDKHVVWYTRLHKHAMLHLFVREFDALGNDTIQIDAADKRHKDSWSALYKVLPIDVGNTLLKMNETMYIRIIFPEQTKRVTIEYKEVYCVDTDRMTLTNCTRGNLRGSRCQATCKYPYLPHNANVDKYWTSCRSNKLWSKSDNETCLTKEQLLDKCVNKYCNYNITNLLKMFKEDSTQESDIEFLDEDESILVHSEMRTVQIRRENTTQSVTNRVIPFRSCGTFCRTNESYSYLFKCGEVKGNKPWHKKYLQNWCLACRYVYNCGRGGSLIMY